MPKLEPKIVHYLKRRGDTHVADLVNVFNSNENIPKEKIEFRINKLVSQKKLSSDNGLISISKNEERRIPKDFDEILEHGPIKVARKGKKTFIQSNWRKEEHERFMEVVKNDLPKLKEDIIQGIKNIEKEIIEKFDPLDVMAYVSARNLMGDPTIYSESSFDGTQLLPEIVQNIILRNTIEKYKEKRNRDKIPDIEEPLNDLRGKLTWYIINDSMLKEGLKDSEKEIYFRTMTDFLYVRGSAYPQHYKEIALELFEKINFKLKEKGFTIKEYYQTIEEINKQIIDNYNQPRKKIKEEHEKFKEFIDAEEEKGTKPSEILKKYLKSSEERRKKLRPEVSLLSEIMLKGSFEIKLNKKINKSLLNILTLEFGYNTEWTFPLDKSDASIKPIIKVDDKYYCFLVPHLIRNVIPIIELSLTQQEKDSLKYHMIKGKFFEDKTMELMKKILPDAEIYPNLHYPSGEIDGIIVAEKIVLLVEVKGKKKRAIAGRQDILGLTKKDFEAHINEAFNQSKKALDYINSKDIAEFKDVSKKTVLKLSQKDIEEIYVINVSAEDFSEMAIDLNLVKLWNPRLIKGEIYPWVLNIYDFIVISDLIERPEDFLDYIKQRIEISKTYEIKSSDELDFLGYYLEHGSLNKPRDVEVWKSPLIHGYSEKIDKWYSYLLGEIDSAEKPSKKV